MGDLQIFLAALFVSAAGLNALANWLERAVPDHAGARRAALGLVPGIPDIHLEPGLVLLVFLPPLLYASAFFADLRTLRDDARVIVLNAIGLTLATAAVVGVIAHELIHLPWAVSFALGAIVSPTDPAAATAIMRRVGAPRRMVNILEGESLVNDAAALVAYKVAVAVAIGESVSAGHTVLTFFGDVAGGVAIGLAVGWVIAEVRKRVNDVNTELTISLFSAYGAFIPADQLGVSGVLAVVACGVVLRLPRPGDRLAREPDAGLRDVVDPHLPAQRHAVHPDRPAAADDRRRAQRPAGGRGDRLRGGGLRGGDRDALHLDEHHHRGDPDPRPAALAARPALELADPGGQHLVGNARRGLAGRGAGAAPAHQRGATASRPRPDPVHHLRADPRDRGRAGADPALADPPPRRRSTTARRRRTRRSRRGW